MKILEKFQQTKLPEPFYWFNEPSIYRLGEGLEIFTDAKTDFWQTTHYGFQRDDGHCLLAPHVGDFTLTTHVEFKPLAQYDQCGLMARADSKNWIKVATEYENARFSRLGSVVTNLGYSDWATQDIASTRRAMWYRLSRRSDDFLLEHSLDGQDWVQMRIAHLHAASAQLEVGVYACSPIGKDFWCRFMFVEIGKSLW
jgi:hypothetical protein